MQVQKPLFEEGEDAFEGGFDEEVEDEDEDVDFGNSFGEFHADSDNGEEEKVDEGSKQALFVVDFVGVGCKANSIWKEGDDCNEEDENWLADNIEMEFS